MDDGRYVTVRHEVTGTRRAYYSIEPTIVLIALGPIAVSWSEQCPRCTLALNGILYSQII